MIGTGHRRSPAQTLRNPRRAMTSVPPPAGFVTDSGGSDPDGGRGHRRDPPGRPGDLGQRRLPDRQRIPGSSAARPQRAAAAGAGNRCRSRCRTGPGPTGAALVPDQTAQLPARWQHLVERDAHRSGPRPDRRGDPLRWLPARRERRRGGQAAHRTCGHPRRVDRAGQPDGISRPGRARVRPRWPGRPVAGGLLPRHRPLQGDQRHPRARGRRRAAGPGCQPVADAAACRGRDRPPRR